MPKDIGDIINKLSPSTHIKVESRPAQLMVVELTLGKLRRARKLTQVKSPIPSTAHTKIDSLKHLAKSSN